MKDLPHTFHALVDKDEVRYKVRSELNEVFGKDVKNLSRVIQIVCDLKQAREDLQQRLQFTTTEAPDKITQAVKGAERALCNGDHLIMTSEELQKKAKEHFKKVSSLLENLGPAVRKVAELKRVETYQAFVSTVEECSREIGSSLHIGTEGQALLGHTKLKEGAKAIQHTQCHHLQAYLSATLLHWNKALLQRFISEFEGVLKRMKWPLVLDSSEGHLPATPDSIQRLCTLTQYLLQLSLQGLSIEDNTTTTTTAATTATTAATPSVLSNFEPLLLPIQLMVNPLEVRFLYHFTGTRATNSTDHPEWYFIQLLKWINSHENFLTHRIQPVLDRCGEGGVSAKIEFIRGMVRLAAIKITTDLPHLQENDDLFCSTIQEALSFDRELSNVHGYPRTQPSIVCVLGHATVFPRWLTLERKFALEVMDELVSSDGAWEVDGWEGSCGGPASCAEKVVLLLQGITDRYKRLPQPGHRLQFLELQLELLDDFRVRLLQMMKGERNDPLTSNYPAILNTAHHITTTLGDWGDLPFFIEMQFYQQSFNKIQDATNTTTSATTAATTATTTTISSTITLKQDNITFQTPSTVQLAEVCGSVFDSTIDLYTHIEGEMINTLTAYMFSEVRARSLPYRRDKCHRSPATEGRSVCVSEVSPSICGMLEVLATHLHNLRDCLATPLFHTLWLKMASTINKYIFEEVILETRFTQAGASQFKFDMTAGLFPIFGEFTQRPENYFRLIKESYILLNLPRPTSLLLKDTLTARENCFVPPQQALAEHGVTLLTQQEASAVLNARIFDRE